jgi:ribonucleotide monophosphatase NagD (HAD superfamily)
MFEKGLKEKDRYPTAVGDVTTEDLWGMPLTSRSANRANLDDTAKTLNRMLKDVEEESFVTSPTVTNSQLRDKLEIVKYVIAAKIEEREATKRKAEVKEQKEKIMEIISRKQNQELESKELGELTAMLDALG